LGPNTPFRIGLHENKEKHLFYFGLKILLSIQIQFLLEIENPKNRLPIVDSRHPIAQQHLEEQVELCYSYDLYRRKTGGGDMLFWFAKFVNPTPALCLGLISAKSTSVLLQK
jgi:hypothetical protein